MRRTLTAIALSMMFALPAFAHKTVTHSVKSAKTAVVAGDSAEGEGTAPAAADEGAKTEKPMKKKHKKHSKKAKETPAPAEEPAK